MTDNQVQRHLRTEELYAPVLKVMLSLDPADMTYSSPEEARGLLDKILSQGKIEGRMTAYTDAGMARDGSPQGDRLIEDWQRIVDS